MSGPRLREELICTEKILYLRFHGRTGWYRHDYSREELRGWAERIRASGASEAWIYFNNYRDRFAIKNARLLQRMLGVGRTRQGGLGGSAGASGELARAGWQSA